MNNDILNIRRSEKISASQLKRLQETLQKHEVDIKKFFKSFRIKHLHELPPVKYNMAVETLKTNPLRKKTNRDAILKAEGFEEISEEEQLRNLLRHSTKIS